MRDEERDKLICVEACKYAWYAPTKKKKDNKRAEASYGERE